MLKLVPMLEASHRTVEGGIALLEIKGRVTPGAATHRPEQAVKSFKPKDLYGVVLGMSGVGSIDSAGVGVLTARPVEVGEVNGRLHRAGPEAKTRQLLRFTGLRRMMPVRPDAETACRALLEKPDPEGPREL